MAEKRYYWLKLNESFFEQKEIKRLRRIAGGDTYTIIYLKMLLRSLKNNGFLYFEGIEENFIDELALDIDEDEDNVKVTVQYLMSKGILEAKTEDEYELLTAGEMTGSETAAAKRMRKNRVNRNEVTQERNNVTVERKSVTPLLQPVTNCYTEIDIDIDKDIELDIDKEKEIDKDIDIKKEKSKRKRFTPPSFDEVKQYCHERNNHVDPQAFIDFYESKGWMVGMNKMADWKAAIRTWEKRSTNTSNGNQYIDNIKNRVNVVDSWL